MYQIAKTWRFAAAHRLDHLSPAHKCHRLHGHNYTVTLTLRAETLDQDGFVVDYGDLKEFGDWIDTNLDHRDLNAVRGSSYATTAEALAEYLFDIASVLWDWGPRVIAVEVKETENTSATFTP